jgi:hypothetical protein
MPQSPKSRSLYDLLDHMQQRPFSYLSNRTLTALKDFISGYFSATTFQADSLKSNEPPFSEFWSWLMHHHKWLNAGMAGWYGVIMDQTKDDARAFHRFFDLLAAYRRRKPELQIYMSLSSAQKKRFMSEQKERPPYRIRLTRYLGEDCLFLHIKHWARPGWEYCAVFDSIRDVPRWIETVFGIRKKQWEKSLRKLSRH